MESNHNTPADDYSQLIKQAEAALEKVRETIKQNQKMEQALLKSIDALKAAQQGGTYYPDSSYPFKGTRQEKAIYILKKYNKAMRISDITEEIMRMEGEDNGRKISKSLNYILNQMAANGDLVIARVQQSKRHVFYCLPQFFSSLDDGRVTINAQHIPSVDDPTWGKLPESERNFDNVKWFVFRNKGNW